MREFRDKASDPNRPTPPVKGGEDRPLPPGEPTFIEQISAAAGGKVGGYNNFWLDPGERVMRDRRRAAQLDRRSIRRTAACRR